MRHDSADKQFELLSEAFDLGLRHFDTAPYYGYGEAERILGRFIRTKRHQVTVTTKFGIQPMAGLGRVASLVKLLRRIAKISPFLRKLLSAQAHRVVQRNAFSVAEAEKSLENSLKALQTDYVDFLLLHEPSVEHLTEELLVFLKDCVKQGKMRDFGISGVYAALSPVPDAQKGFCSVLQFENSVLIRNRKRLTTPDSNLIITYRALNQTLTRLQKHLAEHNLTKTWSESLDADCSNANVLSGLLFAWACKDNSKGVVLFSTSSPEHLRKNMACIASEEFSSKQLLELENLVCSACL